MTWKKSLWFGLFVLATLLFVLSRFYFNIQNEHWRDNTLAVQAAYEKTIMTKANKVESFYGDVPMQIVYGEDKIGQQVIVWVTEEDVHSEMAAEAFTLEQIRQTMLRKAPDAELLRIMPGKLGGDYVWEVFYKRNEESGVRHYYDYYSFKDGTYLDTWRLSLN